jgi:protein-disulfide isomerase
MNQMKVVGILFLGLVIGGIGGYFINSPFSSRSGGVDLGKNVGTCGNDPSQAGLFMVDGTSYQMTQLPGEFQQDYFDLNNESHLKSKSLVQELAMRMALAKDKSDLSKLPPLTELLPMEKVSDKEIQDFFNQNKNRFPPQYKLEDLKENIVRHLQGQKVAAVFQTTWQELEKKGRVKLTIASPIPPIANIDHSEFPLIGDKDHQNTLVEVSDYLCGHCQKIHPEVKEVIKKLGKEFKFVQMNYSLAPEGLSGVLNKTALCAYNLNPKKFWEFHDNAFVEFAHDHQADGDHDFSGGEAAIVKTAKFAAKFGYDEEAIKKCVNDPKTETQFQKNQKMLSEAGVRGTPTFFLQQRKLSMTQRGLMVDVQEALRASPGASP